MGWIAGVTIAMSWLAGGEAPAAGSAKPLAPVPFTDVTISDAFWKPRVETARRRTLPHVFRMCEQTGRIANFDRAAGRLDGDHEGYFFNDSDVYKAVEAAAYALATERDPGLEQYVDDLIARIAAAQQPDGYLNTYFALTSGEQPWGNLRVRHELYCAGHLIEAAIAHHQATGKSTLLDVAVRFADLIGTIFGPGKRRDVPGHEEIELALIKLADLTSNAKYAKLAEFFLEQRGRPVGRELYGEYCQDHLPVSRQDRIVGHAVRAAYLYCAMADVARRTGSKSYLAALDRVWHDTVQAKMYITGGIGPSSRNEGFTEAHDLPNDTAYAETCASIGMVLWAHRLNLLHADARYVDVLERVLCNGLLSGVSLNGEGFFYTNPLASRGKHHRRSWYKCACCPPNIARIMLSLGGYVYARTDRAVFVNLYMGSRAKINLAGTTVSLTQQTRYPWDGQVKLTVEPASAAAFELFLRLPAWCDAPRIRVGGEAVTKLEVHAGYVRLRRTWQSGDVVELDLPMPVERIEAHPRVAADTGRVALQRGPIVYCLEAADNSMPVRRLSLPREARLTTEDRPGLLGGVTVITGTALAAGAREWRDWEGALYHPATAVRPVAFVAIPYYAWDNREPGEMVVWLPETLTLVEPPPVAGIVPSASHCFERDTVAALHDRLEPRSSADQTIPRFTWWNRRGSREWVQYDFDQPRRVSGCRVYWFDDRRSGGHCRVPASWKLLYRDGNDWREIPDPSAYGIELDEYNTATFTPVETTALRIEVELQPDFSGGILEWKASEK